MTAYLALASNNAASLVWNAASRQPDRVAIIDAGIATACRELRDRSRAVAAALADLGIPAGTSVAVLMPKGAQAAAALFGALAAGMRVVPLNDRSRRRQIEYVLTHAQASVVVSNATTLGENAWLRTSGISSLTMDQLAPALGVDRGPAPVLANDPALLMYTSGSEGMPKGVLLSHGNLTAAARTISAYLELTDQDRVAGLLPFGFVYGLTQLLSTIASSATLIVEHSFLTIDLLDTLQREQVTVLGTVPLVWGQLSRTDRFCTQPVPSLRVMTNAGARLAPDIVRALRRAQPQARLFLMYGLTEAMRSAFVSPEEVDRFPDAIGRPVPDAELLVLRPDMTECAAREVGELAHIGPTVALGYWRDPEATSRVFRRDPRRADGLGEPMVLTGDLGWHDEEMRFFLVGRRDRIIKTMGYRVGPDEVSDVVRASGLVADVAIVAEPDAERGQRIVAHVVMRDGALVPALRRFCQTEMPRYIQPARFVEHEALPRLTSGKIDYTALSSESD